jgi:putative NADPH-quinone reductase
LKKCSIRDDDWGHLSEKILAADVLVFASPIYFHHLPGPMKTMIDRFRSFMHVQITESGLRHTPWQVWKKEFVLLLSMGSSDDSDSDPLVELFRFMTSILGQENRLHLVKAARLAVANQVTRSSDELHTLYEKLDLPPHLAEQDFVRNNRLLDDCYQLGFRISKK